MRLVLYDAAFPALAQLADGQSRRISYLTLFGGLASTVFWPVEPCVVRRYRLANTFLVYAGLHLCICLPLHFLVLTGPVPWACPGRQRPAGSGLAAGTDRNHAMAAFATVIALNGLVFSAISAHVVPLFEGLGFSAAAAVRSQPSSDPRRSQAALATSCPATG